MEIIYKKVGRTKVLSLRKQDGKCLFPKCKNFVEEVAHLTDDFGICICSYHHGVLDKIPRRTNHIERTKAALQKLKSEGRILGARHLVPFGFKKVNGGKHIEDLKPNGEYQTLKEILNPERSVSELIKETGMAKSSLYYIRNNPIYKVLI